LCCCAILTKPARRHRLWILKNTILEFFRRLNVSWERNYVLTLNFIRAALVATFIAVVISDLAECQPFSHYWQVLPDPGGQCRQGYAQLITMAVCNVFTDLLLVLFPVPIIVRSSMSLKRKTQLLMLFSLSLSVVVTTLYRVPHIIEEHGNQVSRSLYASVELLFATAAANALVLGSFVRDRGVKKKRFKYGSVAAGSLERTSASGSRRPTLTKHWGSLEDLARDTGFGVQPELRDDDDDDDESPSQTPRPYYEPAKMAAAAHEMHHWQFPSSQNQKRISDAALTDDTLIQRDQFQPCSRSNSTASPRKVSFLDVGSVLDSEQTWRDSYNSTIPDHNAPSPVIPAGASGLRRGSTAFLQDIGGLLSSSLTRSISPQQQPSHAEEPQPQPQQPEGNPRISEPVPPSSSNRPMSPPVYPGSDGKPELTLRDPGGLLSKD
jgi:hypothetical protein